MVVAETEISPYWQQKVLVAAQKVHPRPFLQTC
jgi:hypothetical protein